MRKLYVFLLLICVMFIHTNCLQGEYNRYAGPRRKVYNRENGM